MLLSRIRIRTCRGRRSRHGIIRFKHIKPLEFLVEQCERLEALRFCELSLEPVFYFVLFDFFEVLVYVVEVSVGGEEGRGTLQTV